MTETIEERLVRALIMRQIERSGGAKPTAALRARTAALPSDPGETDRAEATIAPAGAGNSSRPLHFDSGHQDGEFGV